MLDTLRASRNVIFWSGVALLIVGMLTLYEAYPRFDSFPNWQRLATLIPLAIAWPMVWIDAYLDWKSVTGYNRGYLFVAPAIPVLLAIAALAWFLISPSTRG